MNSKNKLINLSQIFIKLGELINQEMKLQSRKLIDLERMLIIKKMIKNH